MSEERQQLIARLAREIPDLEAQLSELVEEVSGDPESTPDDDALIVRLQELIVELQYKVERLQEQELEESQSGGAEVEEPRDDDWVSVDTLKPDFMGPIGRWASQCQIRLNAVTNLITANEGDGESTDQVQIGWDALLAGLKLFGPTSVAIKYFSAGSTIFQAICRDVARGNHANYASLALRLSEAIGQRYASEAALTGLFQEFVDDFRQRENLQKSDELPRRRFQQAVANLRTSHTEPEQVARNFVAICVAETPDRPQGSFNERFFEDEENDSDAGYAVFYVNVRGDLGEPTVDVPNREWYDFESKLDDVSEGVLSALQQLSGGDKVINLPIRINVNIWGERTNRDSQPDAKLERGSTNPGGTNFQFSGGDRDIANHFVHDRVYHRFLIGELEYDRGRPGSSRIMGGS